jgi:hypothetical protein
MEDATSQGTTHDLLLALAGRVDDDLLRWARELVALGEDARAVEMLTASLVAARAVLPAPVRSAVVAAAQSARTDLGAASALPPPQPEDGTEHRFTAPDGHDPVAGALLDLPPRPLAGATVLLARRLTPAGTAPGPLPHPVVLVRVHAGTRPADVLAYQLSAALERAGTPASVEVLPADGPVPDYHAAALNVAVELRGEADKLPWRPVPAPQADRDEAVTVTPVTVAPVTVAPVVERHSLAPPVDPPARRLEEPAERPTEEAHPLAHRDPAPAPERPVADVLARHTPSPPAWHSDQHGPAAGAPHRRRDVEPPAAEPARNEHSAAATERLQSADGRLPLPEREPEGSESATEQLRFEPGRGHRRDDDDRDSDRRANRRGYADYDRDDADNDADDADNDADDELVDSPDAAREDDLDDIRDDFRDGSRNGYEPAEEAFPEPLSPHPLAAPRPLPLRDESRPARPTRLPTPPHTPVRPSDTPSRPTVTPISRPAVANPIPMVRRGGPAPIPQPLPVTEPRPAVRRLDDARDDARDDGRDDGRDDLEPLADERAERPATNWRPPRPDEPQPVRGETPAFNSLSDPLNDPLNQPLLAPLLDPTRPEDDPLGLADRRPTPAEPQDDEWSEEWLSGTWAMAPSALDERADTRPEREPDPTDDVEPGRPAPRPVPRAPARHRFTDEPAAANGFPDPVRGRADDEDDAASAQAEAGDHEPDRPELGLRPDSIARLSDADRQLLARLQSELLDGRRQRIGRRITNGTRASTNGSHRGPPDFAG